MANTTVQDAGQAGRTRIQLAREIDRASEDLYAKAKKLADVARENISQKDNKSQLVKLERLAHATGKVADIKDYIKIRAGRRRQDSKGSNVRQGAPTDDWSKVAEPLLEEIEKLKSRAESMAARMRDAGAYDDGDLERQVWLALCREFLGYMLVHYIYGGDKQGDDNGGPTISAPRSAPISGGPPQRHGSLGLPKPRR